MPVVLADLGHRFDQGEWLFRHLNYTFTPGKTYALVGPSGSGKSTLLGLLSGWLDPLEGKIQKDTGNVAWVFQNPTGTPHRSALDLVAYPFLVKGLKIKEAQKLARSAMTQLGLEHLVERPFKSLSGGEAQRLMLARAIAIKPSLLLIDEPTAQLDRTTAQTVSKSIQAIVATDTIIIVATHDTETRDYCSEVIDLAKLSNRGKYL